MKPHITLNITVTYMFHDFSIEQMPSKPAHHDIFESLQMGTPYQVLTSEAGLLCTFISWL